MTYYPYRNGENTWLNWQDRSARGWEQPVEYDPSILADREEMARRLERGTKLHRTLGRIAEDLFEYEHPDKKNDRLARTRFTKNVMRQGDYFGRWMYFGWDDVLVQYPERDLHRELRTYRHRELLTREDQQRLGRATILFAGLSVGSIPAIMAAHMGMGDKYILSDPDTISLANLNRLPWATMRDVGLYKTDALGIHISELDPYIEQRHYTQGITDRTAERIADINPDLMYEHTDDLHAKLQLRQVADRIYAPFIMATDVADLSLVDIERHDDKRTPMFLGKVSEEDKLLIENNQLTPADHGRLVETIVGKENISERMEESIRQIGKTIAGYPQYGTAAMIGGAFGTVAGRDILLGHGPATGRYVVSPQRIFRGETY